MSPQSKKKEILAISILGALVWASLAPLYIFFGVYLRSLGCNYSTIGLILTAGSFLFSVPQVIFGAIADKIRNRRLIMSLALLGRTIASLMLLMSTDLVSISAWYVGTSFLLSGFMPLTQSMVANISGRDELGTSMGRYRLFGSAGWAGSCILTGFLAKDALRSIFPITFFLSGLAFLISASLPEMKNGANQKASAMREEETDLNLGLTAAFMSSVVLAGLSMGATSSFLTISLSQLGGDALFLGLVLAAGALLEIPAMYLAGLLCDRVGNLSVLLIGETGLGAVYWLYGTVKDLPTYLLVQGIRGIMYSLLIVSGMAASSSLGGKKRGSLYAGLYGLSSSLGLAAGPYLGGLISENWGLWAMFLFSSSVSILSAILIIPFVLRKNERLPST